MRFQLLTLATLFLASAAALKAQSQYLVSFPNETPQSEVDRALDLMKEGGSIVVHEFKLIKGFAVKATEAVMEQMRIMNTEYPPIIEKDSVVELDGSTDE